jgi:glycosyltransferase 2 family protein
VNLRKWIFTGLRVLIAVAILLFLARSGAIEWTSLGRLFTAWRLLIAAVLVMLADVIVTAARLCVLLRPRGYHLSLWSSVRLTMIATFFSTCLPGASSELVRIYFANAGNRGRQLEIGTVVILDRVMGMLALVALPVLIAPLFPRLIASSSIISGLLWGAAAFLAAAVAFGFAASSEHGLELARRCFSRIPFGKEAMRMLETVAGYRRYPGTLAGSFVISVLAHVLTVSTVLILSLAMDAGGFAWEMCALIPVGFLANMLPLTPGGLGVGESALSQLYGLAGLRGGAEALLAWRVVILFVGLIGLVFYLQGRRQVIRQVSGAESYRQAEQLSTV